MLQRRHHSALAVLIGLALAPHASAFADEIDATIDAMPVRGIIRSMHQATLATDMHARITRLPVREGQAFEKGDILVEFECGKLQAELDAALAEHRGNLAARDTSRTLRKLNAAGSFDVAMAEAQSEKSQANVDAAQSRLDQCRIKAPFSGRVLELLVNEFDMPAANGALMRIIDHKNLEIELIAPSAWLRWLRQGTPFTLAVDETGSSIPAAVSEIGAAVDAVSQTVKLRATITSATEGVLPGMSGTAQFEQKDR